MITERQEKLLNFLIREYISTAEPVSSTALKKVGDFDISAATVRNDLQELTEAGFISQPHTSAGRIPTQKAYKHFAEKLEIQKQKEFDEFILRQVRCAHEEMEREMKLMEQLMQTLENDNIFEILTILETWHRKTMN
jgi:heat-inducible transcriptional repressor